jgi:hypothetical protein
MKQIQPIDYSITLSTNERIDIIEIDVNTVPGLDDPDVASALPLSRCMNLTRDIIEDAKRGNDRIFRDLFRSPLSGLMKVEPHICRLHKDCVFYNKRNCSARMIEGRHHLPICWEYESPAHLNDEKRFLVSMIGTEIVLAWANDQVVVIIKD